MSDTFPYAQPGVMVDCAVFGFDKELKLLLIKRGLPPFEGRWALPGGFVHVTESLDEAAGRELFEETGLRKVFLEQFHTFGDVERFPSKRVISVAYFALVKLSDHRVRAATDASDAAWFPMKDVPKLGFDHNKIASMGLERIQARCRKEPIGFELLPPKFSISRIQHLYEALLGRPLDNRNFRKKVLGLGFLNPVEKQEDVAHRAAQLYEFDKKKYQSLRKQGIHFAI